MGTKKREGQSKESKKESEQLKKKVSLA